MIEQIIIFFNQIFQSSRSADDKLDIPILNFGVVLFDDRASNEELNTSFCEFA